MKTEPTKPADPEILFGNWRLLKPGEKIEKGDRFDYTGQDISERGWPKVESIPHGGIKVGLVYREACDARVIREIK